MMIAVAETLWRHLESALSGFAEKLSVDDPTLIRDIGRYKNDAFLLRAYLAFRRRADGDEVAVIVDVQGDGQQITIVSDAFRDDGSTLACGPSAAIRLSDEAKTVESALYDWLGAFERFLLENKSGVAVAVSRLA